MTHFPWRMVEEDLEALGLLPEQMSGFGPPAPLEDDGGCCPECWGTGIDREDVPEAWYVGKELPCGRCDGTGIVQPGRLRVLDGPVADREHRSGGFGHAANLNDTLDRKEQEAAAEVRGLVPDGPVARRAALQLVTTCQSDLAGTDSVQDLEAA